MNSRWHALGRLGPALAAAAAFRFACYAAMTALALANERRSAPSLPDVIVDAVPFVPWVSRVNYLAWLLMYLPLALALLWLDPKRWIRYMTTGGVVSLARGACIILTGLGPPDLQHVGRAAGSHPFLQTYLELLSPFGVFSRGAAHAYLTKDLFFSGHTATTFLLLLYVWDRPALRFVALAAHVIVVATVMLAHLHYSIDVIGAWGITFAIFAVREWVPRQRS